MVEPKVIKSTNWESALTKLGAVCFVSGREFGVGDEYVSCLLFSAEEGWIRRDVAPECFDQLDSRPFAFWRAKVQVPDSNKPRPLDVNFLTEFFRRLLEQKEAQDHRELGYIVTLLLVRKKVLKQIGMVTEGDQEFFEVRFTKEKEGPTHRVLIPEITAEKMEMIRDDLGRIFNLGDELGAPKAKDSSTEETVVETQEESIDPLS